MVEDNRDDKELPKAPIDPNIIQPGALAPGAPSGKLISEAAKRALFEAAQRRKASGATMQSSQATGEISGPKGAEPTRFGDWERGGIAYDF